MHLQKLKAKIDNGKAGQYNENRYADNRSGGYHMTTADKNLLDYIVVCISEFANRNGMHMRDAYIYLKKHNGIDFLKEFYDVEHTLSFDEALDDLAAICRKNGGVA